MAFESLKEQFTALTDKILESSLVAPIKTKFDELDAETRQQVLLLSRILLAAFATLMAYFSYQSQSEVSLLLDERLSLIHKIELSKEELSRLKERSGSSAALSGMPWEDYFKNQAQSAGILPTSLTIAAVTPSDHTKQKSSLKGAKKRSNQEESLYTIEVPKFNIRQLTHFTNYLETGSRVVKVRRIEIEQESEDTGYLKAVYHVSGITVGKL